MIDPFLNHCCTVVTKSTNSGPNRGFGKPNRTDPNSEPNRGYFKNRTEFRTEPEKVIPHTPIDKTSSVTDNSKAKFT